MLNRRIKSLLIAGLLVVGMSGAVFANGEGDTLPLTGKATIENPKFDANGQRVISQAILNGDIKVTLVKKDGDLYDITISWDSTKINVTGMKSYFENGTIGSNDYFDPEYHCADIKVNGNIHSVELKDLGGMGVTELLGKLVKVEIFYEAVKDDEPVTPPADDPEDITDEPVAGDTNMAPIGATAAVSAAGLLLVNRKDKDDEE